MIEFTVVPNNVTEADDYRAQVHYMRTVGLEEIVDQIVRQGSMVTRADILGVLEDYHIAVEYLLLQGYRVNTPHARYGVSVRGVFERGFDSFDPARHQIVARISPGRRLQEAVSTRGRAVRTDQRITRSRLLYYVDMATGEWNGTVVPGGIGQIIGTGLQFDPADPAQGIYFVGADDSETKIEMMGHNKPRNLTFVVPPLAPGEYRLEVRTAGEDEKRTNSLDAVLTVSRDAERRRAREQERGGAVRRKARAAPLFFPAPLQLGALRLRSGSSRRRCMDQQRSSAQGTCCVFPFPRGLSTWFWHQGNLVSTPGQLGFGPQTNLVLAPSQVGFGPRLT